MKPQSFSVALYLRRSLVLILLWFIAIIPSYGQLPAGFHKELVSTAMEQPTSMVFLPDGKLLIAQKTGEIIIGNPQQPAPVSTQPYLTLTNIFTDGEHGLVDIAIDPNFAINGYFYVYYTQNFSSTQQKNSINTLSRFQHNFATNQSSLASETVLWENPVPNASCCHMGGSIIVNNDGTIFLTVGDDFDLTQPQDLSKAGGKVIRINSDGSIPNDNPFVGTPGAMPEIYAYGMRNPFRASKDPVSGHVYIGEVGGNNKQTSWEDIHLLEKGANFGWPGCGEGGGGRNSDGSCVDPSYADPIFTYPHNGGKAAVMGGVRYRGSQFPSSHQGAYFYGDYSRRWIRYLTFNAQGNVLNSFDFDNDAGLVLKILEGPDGSLYYLNVGFGQGTSIGGGALHRYVYNTGNQSPVIEAIAANPTSGNAPLSVNFTSTVTDQEGDPIAYAWSFGDGATSTQANPSHTYTANGIYHATLVVSDGNSSISSNPIKVSVGNAPTVSITAPVGGSTFRGGDVINFQAVGQDDDPLDESSYRWSFAFYHNGVNHPRFEPVQASQGSFVVPVNNHVDFSGNTGYVLTVEVTDQDGLTTSEAVQIWSDKSDLTLTTNPVGIPLLFDGLPIATPFTIGELINFQHTIDVGSTTKCVDGTEYQFTGWSDGGAARHVIATPENNTTITANFSPVGDCSTSCQALAFNGSKKLNLTSPITLNADFTLEFWAKLDPTITNADAPLAYDRYQMLNFYASQLRLYVKGIPGSDDAIVTSHQTVPDVWTHYALVREGTQMRAYINGVEDTQAQTNGQWGGPFVIQQMGGGSGFLKGELDEVRVWQTARSGAQISANYNSSVSSSATGLEAYYSFDEASGPVQDLSGNAHHSVALPSGISRTAATSPTSCGGGTPPDPDPDPTNQLPVARAGDNQTVVDSDGNGSESVQLDGSASSDPDGSIVSYAWSDNGSPLPTTQASPLVDLSVGVHTIQLTVTDNEGGTHSDDVVVTVQSSTPGSSCQALAFNGSKKLNLTSPITLNADFTLEFWAKLDPTITNADAPLAYDRYQMLNFYASQLRLYVKGIPGSDDAIVTSHQTVPDVWTHYALVREGTQMRAYINGVEDTQAQTNGQWGGPFVIQQMGGGSGFLKGELDEVRVWQTARSGAQISANYNSSVSSSATGLEAYYSFDEASGPVQDLSGNAHHSVALPSGISRTTATSPTSCGGGTVRTANATGKGTSGEDDLERLVSGSYTATVYPNPMRERFTIDYQGLADESLTVVIYDMVGHVVYERTYDDVATQGQLEVSLDPNRSSAGIHIVKLLPTRSPSKMIRIMHEP